MPDTAAPATVAYVLKGWPRISELFIASEIYRLEQAGLPLRLYVHQAAGRGPDAIRSSTASRRRPTYLPPTTQPVGDDARRAGCARTCRAVPARRCAAPPAATRPGWRAPPASRWPRASARARAAFAWPRKLYVKELLQAVALADELAAAPDVRHLHAHFAHGTTTVTWLCSAITGLPFSFTGHAKDIYSPSLNPAGLLRRKLLAARFAVTCTEANARHLKAIAPEAVVHRVYHGLNADFSRLMGEERAAAAPGPNGTLAACSGSGASWRRRASTSSSTPAASSTAAASRSRP